MTQNSENVLSLFIAQIKQIKSYEEALGVLYWDLRTGAPRKGMEVRSEAIGQFIRANVQAVNGA